MDAITTEQMVEYVRSPSRIYKYYSDIQRRDIQLAIEHALRERDALKAEVERRCRDAAKIIKVRDDALTRAEKAEADAKEWRSRCVQVEVRAADYEAARPLLDAAMSLGHEGGYYLDEDDIGMAAVAEAALAYLAGRK